MSYVSKLGVQSDVLLLNFTDVCWIFAKVNSMSSNSCEENTFNVMVLGVHVALMTKIFYQQRFLCRVQSYVQ